jgi:hypothetical protein
MGVSARAGRAYGGGKGWESEGGRHRGQAWGGRGGAGCRCSEGPPVIRESGRGQLRNGMRSD